MGERFVPENEFEFLFNAILSNTFGGSRHTGTLIIRATECGFIRLEQAKRFVDKHYAACTLAELEEAYERRLADESQS